VNQVPAADRVVAAVAQNPLELVTVVAQPVAPGLLAPLSKPPCPDFPKAVGHQAGHGVASDECL